jgi:hypothetical protein
VIIATFHFQSRVWIKAKISKIPTINDVVTIAADDIVETSRCKNAESLKANITGGQWVVIDECNIDGGHEFDVRAYNALPSGQGVLAFDC